MSSCPPASPKILGGFCPDHVLAPVDCSQELCISALTGDVSSSDGRPTACEAVQYVTAALRTSRDAVALLYGVNDCTSARATLSLERLDQLLEFSYDPPSDGTSDG